MWRSVLSGAGFSLWGFVLASTKPRRLKPAPPNPPNSSDAPSLLNCKAWHPRHCCLKNLLRDVLAAASAQIDARPSGGTQLNIQRRVKHLLQ
jgi:hypothetical protein